MLGDKNEAGLKDVAATLCAAGADVIIQRCDVTSEADVAALVNVAVTRFGRLDIGINNAGVATSMKPLIETEEYDLDCALAHTQTSTASKETRSGGED